MHLQLATNVRTVKVALKGAQYSLIYSGVQDTSLDQQVSARLATKIVSAHAGFHLEFSPGGVGGGGGGGGSRAKKL